MTNEQLLSIGITICLLIIVFLIAKNVEKTLIIENLEQDIELKNLQKNDDFINAQLAFIGGVKVHAEFIKKMIETGEFDTSVFDFDAKYEQWVKEQLNNK